MPLSITASRSSTTTSSSSYRVSKPKRPNPLASRKKTPSSSPLKSTTSAATKRLHGSTSTNASVPHHHIPLPDRGPAPCIPSDVTTSIPNNTVDMIAYITSHMFDPIPARRSGMNSTRIAEVLNFRRALPPIVTKGHVLALSSSINGSGGNGNGMSGRSYTTVEREIAGLVARGVMRKLVIPGLVAASGSGRRGVGDRFRLGGDASASAGASIGTGGSGGVEVMATGGEGLVLVKEWERMVEECTELSEDIKRKYLSALYTNPTSPTVTLSSSSSSTTLTSTEATILVRTGFLTSSYSPNPSTTITNPNRQPPSHAYTFSLPNTGPYLYILRTAKEHLRTLAVRTSSTSTSTSSTPKSKIREVPRTILQMRWDGTGTGTGTGSTQGAQEENEQSILADTPASNPVAFDSHSASASASGTGPIPVPVPVSPPARARTSPIANANPRIRKWKQFRGLAFDWVLCECVGSGAMECFATGSVGVGVRLC